MLRLLKNAQNTAFTKLVVQNMLAELGATGAQASKPHKILKIVHFLHDKVLLCNDHTVKSRDFARVQITEGLIPAIVLRLDNPCQARNGSSNFEGEVSYIVQGLNSSDQAVSAKRAKKVDAYTSQFIPIEMLKNDEATQRVFSGLSVVDIFGSYTAEQSTVALLMARYSILLRDSTSRPDDDKQLGDASEKELTKEQLME